MTSACVALIAALSLGVGPLKPVVVSAETQAKQPQVAVDERGRVFVAFGVGNTVEMAVSTDGGQSFGAAVEVGRMPALSLGMRRGPRVAATDGAVVVTAVGGELGKGKDGDVLAWRSADEGRTWSGPVKLNSVPGSAREGLHALASAPDGSLFCAWLDLRNDRMELFGARSLDQGKTWERDLLVYRAPEKSICTCCHPSAAFAPDGTLYVMFRNDVKGSRDMYLARSTDGGKTFTEAEKLGEKTWVLNKCPMDGGAIAAGPKGRIDAVWTRASEVYSDYPGAAERRLGAGVQPWAAPGPNGPVVVWLESRPGRLRALSGTLPLVSPLSEKANDPVVGSGPMGRGPVVAAWEESSGGLRAVVIDSGTGAK